MIAKALRAVLYGAAAGVLIAQVTALQFRVEDLSPIVFAVEAEPIPEALQPEEPAADPAPYVYNDPEIPDEVEEAARAAAEIYPFSPEFLMAIAFYESSYDPSARNGDCCGLMQVSTRWHSGRVEKLGYTVDQIWDPAVNMLVAADYLQELALESSNLYWILMTYNGDAGAGRVLQGGEPSAYARKVVELAGELQHRKYEATKERRIYEDHSDIR